MINPFFKNYQELNRGVNNLQFYGLGLDDDMFVISKYKGVSVLDFEIIITNKNDSSINKTYDEFSWQCLGCNHYHSTGNYSINSTATNMIHLCNGISIYFGRIFDHTVSTKWTFSSHPFVQQITLDDGYRGSSSYVNQTVYRVPSTFFISDQPITVWKLTLPFTSVVQGAFKLEINGSSTSCFGSNEVDYTIEKELNSKIGCTECITVVKSINNIQSLFTYHIYFESSVSLQIASSLNASTCTSFNNLTLVKLDPVGQEHIPLSRFVVPLSTNFDSSVSTFYRGPSIEGKLYKINGNIFTVKFLSNIGDIPPLTIAPTEFLTSGVQLKIRDDIVRGYEPLAYDFNHLHTGIEYFSRIRSYTRGVNHGYSNYTYASSGATPAVKPSLPTGFKTSEVYNTKEIQELTLSASHLVEIQNLTIKAASYAEVQEIEVKATQGNEVDSNITLRFPEIQVVSILSDTFFDTGGLTLTYYHQTDVNNKNVKSTETTTCLSVGSTESQIKSALETLNSIDTVEVKRSVVSGYTPRFGYQWTISFTGNNVTGDVLPLNWTSCNSLSSSVSVDISTTNTNKIVGLDTEIQRLNVYASDLISQGQYTLRFGSSETECIEWDATAEDLSNSLGKLVNIDTVFIERFGSYDEIGVNLNYMIYFVGNMLHLRNDPYSALPTITVNYNASCIPIKHFVNGNLTEFSLNELSLNSTVVRTRGYDLQTSTLSGKDLSDRFTLMPSFVKVNDIRRSLSTDRRGYIWTLNFDSFMGNTPSVVCGQAPLTSQYQTCSHSTIIDGNFIQGYFILGNSKLLSASISASEMETELELLEGFGDISVSRIGPTSQNGYTWLITWLTAVGKQPIIPVSNSLTGANTVITIDRIQEGNYLSGFYKLQMEGVVSSLISVDASVLAVKTALSNMKTVGLVDVSLSPLVTTEGGKSYLITFIDKKGDIPLLIPEIHNVSGVGATINVFEARKGSVANGTQLRLSFESQLYCSQSNVKVGNCGSPVDNYEISVGPTVSVSDKTFPYTPDYNIQIVRIAVPSFYQKYNFSDVSSTGYFTLTYDGHVSAPISAEASETDLRDVIEAFPGVSTVRVSRTLSYELVSRNIETVPGALFITCSQSDINCGFFDLPPGQLHSNYYIFAYLFSFF